MVDWVWLGLIVGGILTAAWHHNVAAVTQAAVAAAGKAVDIAFGFIGIMTLWLGLARVAEDSGLMRLLARALAPLFRRLFPALPRDHPAIGSMAMNIVANMLGMGGAATPFGLKAMEELERLNPHPHRASADMITFIAVNTAALNLVPATMIALRVAAGSRNPTDIVGPTILVTGITTVVVVLADRFIRRWNRE
ncbi:spore maturation protein [Candidatus Hydrogenisulfobacillus filiaventi]|uniref:Spore maturation protein n=1 Tax=Candidatus Hydrogenisulfobacillus filiaventi TaxID=2707344 RepID=A0A6F8ZG31_9FIRM|nr:nucleoside recognition protein [Bacillota bacterium]CAB1128708.1 spore maturation protein [Candidatus Hydrogenisulfobacillus filiaventi]